MKEIIIFIVLITIGMYALMYGLEQQSKVDEVEIQKYQERVSLLDKE